MPEVWHRQRALASGLLVLPTLVGIRSMPADASDLATVEAILMGRDARSCGGDATGGYGSPIPYRIGLCPVHAVEFYMPLDPGDSYSCPVAGCECELVIYGHVAVLGMGVLQSGGAMSDLSQNEGRLTEAFVTLTADERQLVTAALAGNHPPELDHLRVPVIRALAEADKRLAQLAEEERDA